MEDDRKKRLKLMVKIKRSGLLPLYKEAKKYDKGEDFVNAVWQRINIKKKKLQGKLDLSQANLNIAKLTNNLDKWGYSNVGWFEGFGNLHKIAKGEMI